MLGVRQLTKGQKALLHSKVIHWSQYTSCSTQTLHLKEKIIYIFTNFDRAVVHMLWSQSGVNLQPWLKLIIFLLFHNKLGETFHPSKARQSLDTDELSCIFWFIILTKVESFKRTTSSKQHHEGGGRQSTNSNLLAETWTNAWVVVHTNVCSAIVQNCYFFFTLSAGGAWRLNRCV